ncbi:putative MFS family arabinose efflux permease [Bradyrhizobium japonicum]|uniref:MFS transporter n=1 Tax=Bradyrhizobium TaxID=374 RepID=UPI00036124FD|nr:MULTISPECIES: MFS transporter [Bradyrhizobium]MCP1728957.1 putative MFS family arabinose efflux permease [Bradyrhizobium elkanii]MCS3573082.1 putative MFS family arabinose efflux permease [Bradyrhizobium elkanii]MCS3594225.1 putative MFS family arabinose efflux permease [Bradyrhizobium elkanii]MCS3623669.1 putative MFS family arabinose efflux permease [Bradyrhizobium elkanii]MCW2117206.1 putative MFS family arabinose efflux permease [Bradyrhizobium elkanii]
MTGASTRQFVYLSHLIIQIGGWAFRIGILIGLLQSGMSAAGLGVAVSFAPIMLGSLFLSPLVDRRNPISVMMIVNAIRIFALLAIFGTDGADSFLSYASIGVLSLVQPVYLSAEVSFFRRITSEDDMISVLRNIANIDWLTYLLGMFAGAMLSDRLHLPGVLAFNLSAIILSLIVLLGIKQQFKRTPTVLEAQPSGTILDLAPLYPAFLAVFLLNLGAGIINVYPAIRATADGVLDKSVLLTIVMTNGVLALLGALAVKPIYNLLGALPTIAGAAVLLAACLAIMSLDAGLPVVIASSSAMLGFGQIFAAAAHSHMVSSVAPDRAGRLSGLFQCCTYGGVAGNGIALSLLSDRLPFGMIVLLCAASAFVAFAVASLAIIRSRHSHA